MDSSGGAPGTAQPGPVRRLTFEYDGDQIRLVSDKTVNLIVPPTQPPEAQPAHAALSVVVRDEQNQPLYRVTRNSPLRYDTEVFSSDPEQSVHRVPVDRPKGAFTVLVPDLPNAHKVEIIGHPLRPEAHAAAAQPLATFALKRPQPQ